MRWKKEFMNGIKKRANLRNFDEVYKNEIPLKKGYIKSQLSWAYRKKPILPPNCKEFYQGIAVCTPDDFCKLVKNPVNYVVRKSRRGNKMRKK